MDVQSQKLKQQLKQSPQQIMLARLLQIPYCSLRQSIEKEVRENPMLDIANENELPDDNAETLDENGMDNPELDDYEAGDMLDEDGYDDMPLPPSHEAQQKKEDAFIRSGISLMEMLQEQLAMLDLSETERTIGNELIGSIDDAGYLNRSLELIANDLAIYHDIDLPSSEIEKVLHKIQTFEPAGIGARNLQECLSLQLHRIAPLTVEVKTAILIVDHYFDEIVKHRYQQLADRLEIDTHQLEEALEVIKHLNPKPGFGHADDSQPAEYVSEDFIVYRNGDDLSFELNDRDLPSLRINPYYLEMRNQIAEKGRLSSDDKQAISFIRENSAKAQLFIDALQQRELTLCKVMAAILKHQHDFFLTGDVQNLRPLMQKEIAEETGLDLSTVSRVVNDKYVRTDFGLLLLRTLFSQAVTNTEGQEVSAEVLKQAIKEIIDHEDKSNPLTDEALGALLEQRGYPLARRTVAKYRTALGYPKGSQRKSLS